MNVNFSKENEDINHVEMVVLEDYYDKNFFKGELYNIFTPIFYLIFGKRTSVRFKQKKNVSKFFFGETAAP